MDTEARLAVTADDVVGAWRLAQATEHDTSTDGDPVVGRPFGDNPQGLILYTPDGFVSAVITSAVSDNLPTVYAGPYSVDEGGLVHEVQVGIEPAGPGTVQRRPVALVDGDLWLSADLEPGRQVRLRWVRAAG